MDRLVCGDVGYGKTEVALRAALLAVLGGRQVAVLAPTTVLVEQHFVTFSERFRDFPVRVASLSRFRKPAEQKAIVRGLAAGTIDVVIGTHRLLSRDVHWKHLGLLVIDEEHRFGVTHKERLKEMRSQVDVLTLTATPIPRTLQMGLAGLREISVITTPPADRLAIRTFVCQFDPGPARRGDRQGAAARRAGLLRAQPRRGPGEMDQGRPRPRAQGPRRHGAWTDAGGKAREGDDRFRRRPLRHPVLYDHHRVRPGHSARQHDDRQPRRSLRARPALPTARPHRPLARACLLLPGRARRRQDEHGGSPAPGRAPALHGAGSGVSDRHR